MYDVIIIGGGMGGLLTCRSLLDRGVSGGDIGVVDAMGAYRGSDNPGAMMHPFPGRLLAPKTGMIEAYLAAAALLDETVEPSPSIPSFRGPMVRPLLEGDVGEAFEASWRANRDSYPDLLSDAMLEGDELRDLGPFSADIERAISYAPAYCVDLGAWMTELSRELRSEGAAMIEGRAESVERRPTSWRVHHELGSDTAANLVLAVGARLPEWFPELNIQPTGGALLVVDSAGCDLRAAVSAGGHIAPVGPDKWVAGATWWHDDEFDTIDDETAGDAVVARVQNLIPSIAELDRLQLWRGVRAVHANDRRPLVGGVTGQKGLFVCGGFGSKGLLWSPYLCDALAGQITAGESPPDFANTERLSRRWWRPGANLLL